MVIELYKAGGGGAIWPEIVRVISKSNERAVCGFDLKSNRK